MLVQLAQWAIAAFSALAFWLTASPVTDERWLWRPTATVLLNGGGVAILRRVPGVSDLVAPIATIAFIRAPFWVLAAGLAGGQLLFHQGLSWSWRAFLVAVMRAARFDPVTKVSEADHLAPGDAVDSRRPRIEIVPNGVDSGHNRPGLAQAQPGTLVFNGGLTYSANYDAMRWFLGEVYPRIKAQVSAVSLTITGATAGVDLVGLALDDSVTLTGYVEDVRLPVAEAAVAVAPIRQGGGTRLKILEAMALGTPVVATTKGAEGLDIVAGEHFLCADDPQTFAARTVMLLQDAGLRRRLAHNARRLVETTYDWSQIGAHFVTLVESAVENTHKRSA